MISQVCLDLIDYGNQQVAQASTKEFSLQNNHRVLEHPQHHFLDW